jgi:hypothetical protein
MLLRPTITFHLGLFPIVLLLWAWADSVSHSMEWKQIVNHHVINRVDSSGSALRYTHTRATTGDIRDDLFAYNFPTGPGGRLLRIQTPPAYRETWFPRPVLITLDDPVDIGLTYRHSALFLPYWLLLASYLPLWLAASFFHARRKQKRHLASLPSSSPAQPQSDL